MALSLILFAFFAVALTIRCHDYFTGRRLLRDVWKEYQIYRADLDALDVFSRTNANRSRAVVSLTTIPSRLSMLEDTIKSLLMQRRAPATIRVYLPHFSKREATSYEVPAWLTKLRSVEVIRVEEDFGPATKFLYALEALNEDEKLIVVDDDRIFQDDLIESLDCAAEGNEEAAFCIGGWVVPDDLVDRRTTLWMYLRHLPPAQIRPVRIRKIVPIDILMGAHGFIVRRRFFDLERLKNFEGTPSALYFADDIWISAHCRAKKFALPSRWADFQPYRHVPRYDRSSIGWINRVGRPELWVNSVALRYFGRDPWLIGER